MQPPLIGLTTYGKDEHGNYGLPANYVDAVRRAKGIPVLIPPGEPQVAALLARLDGLILTGGGDLDPAHYVGADHEAIYMVDPERDRTEIALSRIAVKNKLPTLGICRGMQVLNVGLGGTLIEHLPDVVGDAIAHRLPPRLPARHMITVDGESHLARCLQREQTEVVSWHHQAVRIPAPGLRPVAHAPDGAIEALEMPEHPWLLAVQWHPEMSAKEDPCQQHLFDALVQAAANLKETR
jgi:putative glutamine amidotransferase